jgi:hypothetical protein
VSKTTAWPGLLASVVGLSLTSGLLYWLLSRYVPTQAAFLEGASSPLSTGTTFVLQLSNWVLRAAPFGILAAFSVGPFAAAIVLGCLALARKHPSSWRTAQSLVMGVAAAELVASGLALYVALTWKSR